MRPKTNKVLLCDCRGFQPPNMNTTKHVGKYSTIGATSQSMIDMRYHTYPAPWTEVCGPSSMGSFCITVSSEMTCTKTLLPLVISK